MASQYLIGSSRDAAASWLHQHGFPETCGDTLEVVIDVYYPGGLQFFVAAHLIGSSDPGHIDRTTPKGLKREHS